MRIILFVHPDFLNSQSMPRYAEMLRRGLSKNGHSVKLWKPFPVFYKIPCKQGLKKWLGYIDQYVVFPVYVKVKLLTISRDTLFVFADQALGPWVPLVRNRPHVVHCHDFLALKSSLGMIPENPISRSGKLYQSYIRNGFSKGLYFVAISLKTEQDLKLYHQSIIRESRLCYNWLNSRYDVLSIPESRSILSNKIKLDLSDGYILHIGGNQYYKNRKGIIEIYDQFRSDPINNIPLLLIGSAPSREILELYEQSVFKNDIHFIVDLEDDIINTAYSGATCLLFPSLDEGFGWPIVEAMASGCPVITTGVAPMSEVAGNAGYYINKRPDDQLLVKDWAAESALELSVICNFNDEQRQECSQSGLENIKRFDENNALENIDRFYLKIVEDFQI